MHVLITGAGGFIGRNMAEWLGPRHRVAAPSRAELDLLDAEAVHAYLEAGRFDAVVHAAAAGVSRRTGGGRAVFQDNYEMFAHLARNRHAFGRLIYLGSGAVYDKAHWRGGMREEELGENVPADDYGFAKYSCALAIGEMEQACELRLFGVFGRYEDWRIRFVSNACCRALWGMPIVIQQDVRFDYLDVEDVCRVVERSLEQDLRRRHYNVCRGETIALTALAAKIAGIAGRPEIGIEVRNPAPGREYGGDNTRLLAEFAGWRSTSLDESLARLYAWYAGRRDAIDPGLLE